MARAVDLPLPLPRQEPMKMEEGPVRPSVAVPDTVLKAVMDELERSVTRRERDPERRAAPATQERARYNHD